MDIVLFYLHIIEKHTKPNNVSFNVIFVCMVKLERRKGPINTIKLFLWWGWGIGLRREDRFGYQRYW